MTRSILFAALGTALALTAPIATAQSQSDTSQQGQAQSGQPQSAQAQSAQSQSGQSQSGQSSQSGQAQSAQSQSGQSTQSQSAQSQSQPGQSQSDQSQTAQSQSSQSQSNQSQSDGQPDESLKVYFGTGSAQIAADQQSMLDTAARVFRQGDPFVMIVAGGADTTGSAGINLTLSVRRAQAVAQALADRGIPADRLQVVGRGTSELEVGTGQDVAERNNRMVEITWR